MPIEIAVLVLAAAAVHALWNAIVKVSDNSLLTLAAIVLTGSAISLAGTFFVSFPVDAATFLILGAILRCAYYLVLIRAYRSGDFSYTYPLLRGTTPLTVAVLAAVLAGDRLGAPGVLGIALITFGILVLTLEGRSLAGVFSRRAAPAILAGLLVAGFTVMDGMGVRAAADPWDFIVWTLVASGIPLLVYVLLVERGRILPWAARHWRLGILSGLLSTAGLWIVLYALQHAPIAAVTALRETSIVIGAMIGAFRFRDRLGGRRILASVIVLAGISVLQLAP